MKSSFKSLAIAIALSAVIPVYGQDKFNSNKSVCEEEASAMASKSEADQMDWMQCVSEGQESVNDLTSVVRVRTGSPASQTQSQTSASTKTNHKSSEASKVNEKTEK